MPPPGSRNLKRRGRPRRKGLHLQKDHHQTLLTDNNDLNDSSEPDMSANEVHKHHSSSNSITSTSLYDKLREERSYKDFYPDLNITQTLTIIRRTRNPYSTESAPLMDDTTTIMTGIPTISIGATASALSPVDNNSDSNSKKRRSLGSVCGVPDHSNKNISNDTTRSADPIVDVETPTINNQDTTTLAAIPTQMISPQRSFSPTTTHTRGMATTTRSPIRHIANSAAVNLAALPKPTFRRVADDDTDEQPNAATTDSSASNKLRRNSCKAKRNQPSSELSQAANVGAEPENDHGGKEDDDGDDSGNESSGKNVGFRRPENHYIRYIEPTEQSLFDMVEYDMDEQDDAWLHMLNVERKTNRLGHVSCSFFENVIDKLEKEWFNLVKHLPKQTDSEPLLSEDSACSICDDGECENSNAIVFCDGCNLAVHQDCYGVPYIPEGQWLCRKCMVSPDKPVSCLFCPNEGGAFKQTNTNKWGHLLCALWIPEVGVSNSVYMEPIDNIEGIPKSRWKLTCYICKKRHGACIQCDNKHCFTAFHVTCARWARLCMRMKTHGTQCDSVLLKAYCDRHTPRDYRDEVDVEKCVLAAQQFLDPKAFKNHGRPNASFTPRRRYVDALDNINNSDMDYDTDGDVDNDGGDRHSAAGTRKRKRNNKSHPQPLKRHQTMTTTTSQQLTPSIKAARAHQHHYSAGAPIAPDYILTRLENLKCVRQAVHLRRRCQLIASICRYWSLKRESRRGAPLLKRLHLEPWTASSSQLKQNELEKAQRAKVLFELRADLEVVRMLSEQVQKREKQKLEQLRRQKEYLEIIFFPVEYIIRPILNQLMEMDKKEYFLYPVTPDVAPDYHEYIDHPMSFHDIIEKFHTHEYSTIDAIEADLSLIWTNSKTYNQSDTSYYKLAQRMEEQATELLAKARQQYNMLEISQNTSTLAVGIDPEIFSYSIAQTIPSTSASKMETNAHLGHGQPGNVSNSHGLKDDGWRSTDKPTKLTPPTKSPAPSKQQAPRSMRATKNLNTSTKRTTRSSSTDVVHINLDDNPRKRKKLAARPSPSPSTPTPISTSHNQSISASASSNETPSSTPCSQIPIANEVNHPIECVTRAPSASNSVPEQTLSSPTLLPLSLKQKPTSSLASEQEVLPLLSLEQQSVSSLPSEQPSLLPLSSKQHSPPLVSSTQRRPTTSPSKCPSPSPSSSVQQPSLTLVAEQQQPLMETAPSESIAPIVSPICPSPSHAVSKPSPHIKQNKKPQNDIVVTRRRTRSSGSDGLTIPTKTGMKNRKMNKETRKLLMPDTMDKPIAYEEGSYKESTTRRAPCGYVYISSSDDDDDEEEEDGGQVKAGGDRRNSNGMPSATIHEKSSSTNQPDNVSSSAIELSVEQDSGNAVNIDLNQHQEPHSSSAKKAKTPKPPLFSEELHTTTPGEIVWARVPGFPYHPAKIADVDQPGFSKKLLANRTKEKTVLVKFYQVPESHRWGWIKPANIYKFGNEENDRLMLEHAKVVKRNKKSRFNEVFAGYEYVCMKLGLQALEI